MLSYRPLHIPVALTSKHYYERRSMNPRYIITALVPFACLLSSTSTSQLLAQRRSGDNRDGDGSVVISGELKQWHKVTLSIQGPYATELASAPNPFTDFRFSVRFRHESGTPDYIVPGYFAADGDAANTSADAGSTWRAHLSPDKQGTWEYTVSFRRGTQVALSHDDSGMRLPPYDSQSGSFEVAASDKSGRDLRREGRLQYVGKHYLRFAGSGRYFIKAGADAPETLLGYRDFDGTVAMKEKKVPLKTWSPHVKDWHEGDPTWQGGKGKGLI